MMSGVSAELLNDTAETVHVSSLALLKMLIHGRQGVPLEVMGLMVGEQLDDYTITVTDCFSMPQTATGQSVEAVDPEYQVQMLDKLALVGRTEKVVGWYHSHPGFGCWLSMEDVMTAGSYERLTPRSVSVVIDPIQSVRGKVVIDAFRTIPEEALMMKMEPRQTTSLIPFLSTPTPQALAHGLGKYYYNLPITFRKKTHEISMLLNVYKKGWSEGVKVSDFKQQDKERRASVRKMCDLARQAEKFVTQGLDEDEVANVGKANPMSHLKQEAENLININLDDAIGSMVNGLVF